MMHEQECAQDRRQMDRQVRTLKPVCIESEGQTTVALMRDISRAGAGFEAEGRFLIGQALRYRWGDEDFREGTVIWSDGDRFGVENLDASIPLNLKPRRYRSVRIPFSAPASIFVGGERVDGEVMNFAQRGLCSVVGERVQRGTLATVKIGSRYFEGVTAKWVDGDRVGFALPAPLRIPEMARLVSSQ